VSANGISVKTPVQHLLKITVEPEYILPARLDLEWNVFDRIVDAFLINIEVCFLFWCDIISRFLNKHSCHF